MSDSDANGFTEDDLNKGDMSDEEALQELRRLIVGPTQIQIDELQERLDDPGRQAKEVGRVLPRPFFQPLKMWCGLRSKRM
jgi:hypothetical protein